MDAPEDSYSPSAKKQKEDDSAAPVLQDSFSHQGWTDFGIAESSSFVVSDWAEWQDPAVQESHNAVIEATGQFGILEESFGYQELEFF